MLLVAVKKGKVLKNPTVALQKDKIPWVYHARGIAIMLIVYRHIVLGMQYSGVEVGTVMYNLQMFFFNFRMPAFFILSGIFIVKSLGNKSELLVARNKVYTLLYPYILWACITLFLQIYFHEFSNARRNWKDFFHIVTEPRSLDQLWYLMALFNASMLFLVLNKLLANKKWLHISIAVTLHFVSFYIRNYDFFSDLFYFYGYFLTGALLSNILLNPEKRDKILNTSYLKWLLPLFVIGQWFWFSNSDKIGIIELIFIPINFIGCYVLFMCALLIARGNKNEWLAYIGRYSLYIYILHVQIAAIMRKIIRDLYPHVDPWLLLSICFICGITIPVLLVVNFRKYGIERLFTLQTHKSKKGYES
jgi:fucose 4-O-acetylase-like acetyltransferase